MKLETLFSRDLVIFAHLVSSVKLAKPEDVVECTSRTKSERHESVDKTLGKDSVCDADLTRMFREARPPPTPRRCRF